MWKTGIALCMAGAFALTGCASVPSIPSQEGKNSYQVMQRDGFRDRDDDRGRDRDRDGRYRRYRPNWWGQRLWYGSGVRPYWWGQRAFVTNSFILLGGYYYPFYFVNGNYYPDYTSPYVFVRGRYRRHYEGRPFIDSAVIRPRQARIINVRREQRDDDDD